MPIPRKKRSTYKRDAMFIAREQGIELDPEDWESIWNLLDKFDKRASELKYVYAIVDYKNNLVKFGRAKSVTQRLKALKTGNAQKLDIWGFCSETPELNEKSIHEACSYHRISGEWFNLVPLTQHYINQIRKQAGIQ